MFLESERHWRQFSRPHGTTQRNARFKQQMLPTCRCLLSTIFTDVLCYMSTFLTPRWRPSRRLDTKLLLSQCNRFRATQGPERRTRAFPFSHGFRVGQLRFPPFSDLLTFI